MGPLDGPGGLVSSSSKAYTLPPIACLFGARAIAGAAAGGWTVIGVAGIGRLTLHWVEMCPFFPHV